MFKDDKYHRYLLTSEWKEKAFARYEIDERCCVGCGSRGTPTNPLECHHITYHNLYHEDIEKDLVTLCHNCHGLLHQIMNRVTDKETGQHGWKDTLTYANRITQEMLVEYLREEIKEEERYN